MSGAKLQRTSLSFNLAKGMTYKEFSEVIANLIGHYRVQELKVVKGKVDVVALLKPGEALDAPNYPEGASLLDLARNCPEVVEEPLKGGDAKAEIFDLLNRVSQEKLYPLLWIAGAIPVFGVASKESHPLLQEDFWCLGLPGYVNDDADPYSLLLFAGLEYGEVRSLTKVYRIVRST